MKSKVNELKVTNNEHQCYLALAEIVCVYSFSCLDILDSFKEQTEKDCTGELQTGTNLFFHLYIGYYQFLISY